MQRSASMPPAGQRMQADQVPQFNRRDTAPPDMPWAVGTLAASTLTCAGFVRGSPPEIAVLGGAALVVLGVRAVSIGTDRLLQTCSQPPRADGEPVAPSPLCSSERLMASSQVACGFSEMGFGVAAASAVGALPISPLNGIAVGGWCGAAAGMSYLVGCAIAR